MTWLRPFLGIFLGDVIFAGGAAALFYFSRVDPHAPAELRFMVSSVAAGMVLALAAGFVAGSIGSRGDMICGLLLGAIIAAGALVSLISRPGQGAIWSQTAALVLMAPAAMLGDWLRLRKARGSTVR